MKFAMLFFGALLVTLPAASRDWPYSQRPSAALPLSDIPGTLESEVLRKAGKKFIPPELDELPDNAWGKLVRDGRAIFIDTPARAPRFAGNGLSCSSCHLGEGRTPGAAPLWGAWSMYPTYRGKNDDVNTFQMRLQDCFRFSLDGMMPPLQSREIQALTAYSQWLARGTPAGTPVPGRGFVPVKREIEPSGDRGRVVYGMKCAVCHGTDGQGVRSADGTRYQFPPVWGDDSFNRGAGMYTVRTAAAYIKGNMPLGRGMSLDDQEAYDVALYLRLKDRPIDPRRGWFSDFSRVFAGY
ncbi:MAG: c-type cytochrome [Thiobacillus sp.]